MKYTDGDIDVIATRLDTARQRITSAGGRDVEVVGVTKGFGPEIMDVVRAIGLTLVGESYAQEFTEKGPVLGALACHFIGRLQTNKVRALSPWVRSIDVIDRPSLADEVARRMPGLDVMVQVNVSDEPQKGGCDPADTAALVEHCRAAGLTVTGLMTIGRAGDEVQTASGCALLRRQVDTLGLAHCSMGMSDDLEIAVREGATQVRLGTALFGSRPSSLAPGH
jgi:PLP dependent protein